MCTLSLGTDLIIVSEFMVSEKPFRYYDSFGPFFEEETSFTIFDS